VTTTAGRRYYTAVKGHCRIVVSAARRISVS